MNAFISKSNFWILILGEHAVSIPFIQTHQSRVAVRLWRWDDNIWSDMSNLVRDVENQSPHWFWLISDPLTWQDVLSACDKAKEPLFSVSQGYGY